MKGSRRIRLSSTAQMRVSRGLQLVLGAVLLIGIWNRSLGITVNAVIALIVTFLPALLERDYDVVLSPALILWLTLAVTLHAVGALGPYRTIWWWDHLTHTLSSAIVAGAGYTAFRAVDEHVPGTTFPTPAVFVFILIFVMAFGVIWEVIEFGVAGIARYLGSGSVLTQYGLEDTMKDLLFDLLGGVIVAVFGGLYLSGVVEDVVAFLGEHHNAG